MERILVTGANGFVGHYLQEELTRCGYKTVSTDIAGPVDRVSNLLDWEDTLSLLREVRPDAVVHLAGQSSVALSWENPALTMDLNIKTTLHLLDAVQSTNPEARLLVVGSSEQYGLVDRGDDMVREIAPLRPRSPYAVSKCAQEGLALALAKARQLDVLCTRSFNHIGPGQKAGFVVPDFAGRIVQIERGAQPVMRVGNLDVYRDFTDVRDITRAYRLLLEKGRSGEVYNVGSGRLYRIADILYMLFDLSDMQIRVETDPGKFRPADLYRLGCNHEKITADTGWSATVDIRASLRDTLAWWREQGKGRTICRKHLSG